MATSYKILGQECPTDTSETTLYTVPSSTSTVVSTLTISNITSSTATASVYVKQGGASLSNENTLLKTVSINGNSINAFTLGITLAATDVISVSSSTADTLTFQLFGSEIS